MAYELTPELAEAIIKECKSRNIHGGSMPSNDEGKVKIAAELLQHAFVAKNAQPNNEDVKVIVNMYENRGAFEDNKKEEKPAKQIVAQDKQKEPEQKAKIPQSKQSQDNVNTSSDTPLDISFNINGIIQEIKKENLPLPVDFQGEPPELPSDWTEIDDVSIRRLYSAYNAANIRMSWIINIEESHLEDADRAAKIRLTKVLNSLDKLDEKGKLKQATMLKEEAANDEEYIEWLKKSAHHRRRYRSFKTLNDGYEKICERISREWTMRTFMYDHSRGK